MSGARARPASDRDRDVTAGGCTAVSPCGSSTARERAAAHVWAADAAPRHHLYWPVGWQAGQAWAYGRPHRFQTNSSGAAGRSVDRAAPIHVLVVQLAGYKEPWFLITSALDLSAAQVVEAWAARFRQEDGFRDHKQRLGMEECRAWTKEPIRAPFRSNWLP